MNLGRYYILDLENNKIEHMFHDKQILSMFMKEKQNILDKDNYVLAEVVVLGDEL